MNRNIRLIYRWHGDNVRFGKNNMKGCVKELLQKRLYKSSVSSLIDFMKDYVVI